jgi:hypothetical protein
MNEDILEMVLDKFDEIKHDLLTNFDIDLRSYDPEDFEDNEDLVDVLSILFQLNEIRERY